MHLKKITGVRLNYLKKTGVCTKLVKKTMVLEQHFWLLRKILQLDVKDQLKICNKTKKHNA